MSNFNTLAVGGLFLLIFVVLFVRLVTPPRNLRHLPRVPILPLLWSYATAEVDEQRIKRLIVPMAEKGDGVIVVFAMGQWMVHVVDQQIANSLFKDITKWPKGGLPEDMLFFRLSGKHDNVVYANGEVWKKHSMIVRSALDRNLPIESFVALGKKLFSVMGNGGVLQMDNLTMRLTLDAVGTTVMGYDFNAIECEDSPFIRDYVDVLKGCAHPLYLVWPRLEKLFPRRELIKKIDRLQDRFQEVIDEKNLHKGNDMLTYMLETPEMTNEEFLSTIITFFIAGHDTTTGAISSFIYYLAKRQDIQAKARAEALQAMGDNGDPTVENMRSMPFVLACVREALRINGPVSVLPPRVAQEDSILQGSDGRSYLIPKGAQMMLNICSISHNPNFWQDPSEFNPDRFIGKGENIDGNIWVPFGGGPRQCAARNFALYEIRVIVALLLQKWTWSLPSGSPHETRILNAFSPFALSVPEHLEVDFKPRTEFGNN